MERKNAEILLNCLAGNQYIISPDENIFMEVLTQYTPKNNSVFCEDLSENLQIRNEGNREFHLSLKRVLINKNVKEYAINKFGKKIEESLLGKNFLDDVTRNIRTNDKLVELMASCEEEFSILGSFSVLNISYSEKQPFTMMTRPVLLIPCLKDIQLIYDYEEENSSFTKEKHNRFMGILPIIKKITAEEYYFS